MLVERVGNRTIRTLLLLTKPAKRNSQPIQHIAGQEVKELFEQLTALIKQHATTKLPSQNQFFQSFVTLLTALYPIYEEAEQILSIQMQVKKDMLNFLQKSDHTRNKNKAYLEANESEQAWDEAISITNREKKRLQLKRETLIWCKEILQENRKNVLSHNTKKHQQERYSGQQLDILRQLHQTTTDCHLFHKKNKNLLKIATAPQASNQTPYYPDKEDIEEQCQVIAEIQNTIHQHFKEANLLQVALAQKRETLKKNTPHYIEEEKGQWSDEEIEAEEYKKHIEDYTATLSEYAAENSRKMAQYSDIESTPENLELPGIQAYCQTLKKIISELQHLHEEIQMALLELPQETTLLLSQVPLTYNPFTYTICGECPHRREEREELIAAREKEQAKIGKQATIEKKQAETRRARQKHIIIENSPILKKLLASQLNIHYHNQATIILSIEQLEEDIIALEKTHTKYQRIAKCVELLTPDILIGKALKNLIENHGDLEGTCNDLWSKETLQCIALRFLAPPIVRRLLNIIGPLNMNSIAPINQVLQTTQRAFVRNMTQLTIKSAIDDSVKLGKNILGKNNVENKTKTNNEPYKLITTKAWIANIKEAFFFASLEGVTVTITQAVGKRYLNHKLQNNFRGATWTGYTCHKIAHIVIGGANGLAVKAWHSNKNKGNCNYLDGIIAGATGALVGEIVTDFYYHNIILTIHKQWHYDQENPDLEAFGNSYLTHIKIAAVAGKIAAVGTAYLLQQDIDIAYQSASNAINNNFLIESFLIGGAILLEQLLSQNREVLTEILRGGIQVLEVIEDNWEIFEENFPHTAAAFPHIVTGAIASGGGIGAIAYGVGLSLAMEFFITKAFPDMNPETAGFLILAPVIGIACFKERFKGVIKVGGGIGLSHVTDICLDELIARLDIDQIEKHLTDWLKTHTNLTQNERDYLAKKITKGSINLIRISSHYYAGRAVDKGIDKGAKAFNKLKAKKGNSNRKIKDTHAPEKATKANNSKESHHHQEEKRTKQKTCPRPKTTETSNKYQEPYHRTPQDKHKPLAHNDRPQPVTWHQKTPDKSPYSQRAQRAPPHQHIEGKNHNTRQRAKKPSHHQQVEVKNHNKNHSSQPEHHRKPPTESTHNSKQRAKKPTTKKNQPAKQPRENHTKAKETHTPQKATDGAKNAQKIHTTDDTTCQTSNTIQKVSRSHADELARALGERVKGVKVEEILRSGTGKIKGYKVVVGNSKKPIVIRLMNAGAGGRKAAYFKIAKGTKGAYDKLGKLTDLPVPSHFDLNPDTYIEIIKQILRLIG